MEMNINHVEIEKLLDDARNQPSEVVEAILDKAEAFSGLTPFEVAVLLGTESEEQLDRIYSTARKIKDAIYGDRIVMFAPLYVSDYCVNNCKYCGYNHDNDFPRRKLTTEEIRSEAAILEKMGHKRIALEAGEDPVNCSIDYILSCMKTLYDMKLGNGEIRRINVNIAATTVEDYTKLKEIGIGTYILFQETYHEATYKEQHPKGPKSNYQYHLTAFDRAMQGGIDDVGAGVLFGLYDPKFEVLALMLHNQHLEKTYGAGFHTISVPRLCKANGITLKDYPHILDDETFKKIVAIIRLAVPYTGMIISTREDEEMRTTLVNIGISQMSGGSSTNVGGYSDERDKCSQFEVSDERTADEIIRWIMDQDLIPSFCTACYRKGRTGDRFMSLAKSGNIKNVCLPNALMTLCEYMMDYGDENFRKSAEKLISKKIGDISSDRMKELVVANIERIKAGERDLFV